MSVEAVLCPLARYWRGDFPAPGEKYCRGKGTTLFRVAPRPWACDAATAARLAAQCWRLAAGEPPPDAAAATDAFHAELLDGVGLAGLHALAQAGPDRGAAFPHLLAAPTRHQVFLPAPVPEVLGCDVGEAPVRFALASATALGAELESLRGRLGDVREWGAVREGEFAAPADDPRLAEKTAWSILRFLARESERRGVPLLLAPAGGDA